MRGWRFVIDEAGFAFDTDDPVELEREFEAYLELLEYARSTPGTVKRSDVLFDIESSSGRTLVDLLGDARIDRDVRYELHGRLDKIAQYDNEPPEWEFLVDAQVLPIAPSLGVCLELARAGILLACLTTTSAARRGRRLVRARTDAEADCEAVHFIADATDAPTFWRAIVDADPELLDELTDYAHLPFPNTVFAAGIWSQISRFDGAAIEIRRALIANLGGLDDHATRIWAAESEPIQRIKQMRITADVNCSPESPQTHRNAKAMRQRLVDFAGEQISCEWHAKLEPQRNRIHFAVRGDQLLVGLFVDHLLC
ncbi:hypothetical protein [Nocardia sp. NPDC004415]